MNDVAVDHMTPVSGINSIVTLAQKGATSCSHITLSSAAPSPSSTTTVASVVSATAAAASSSSTSPAVMLVTDAAVNTYLLQIL